MLSCKRWRLSYIRCLKFRREDSLNLGSESWMILMQCADCDNPKQASHYDFYGAHRPFGPSIINHVTTFVAECPNSRLIRDSWDSVRIRKCDKRILWLCKVTSETAKVCALAFFVATCKKLCTDVSAFIPVPPRRPHQCAEQWSSRCTWSFSWYRSAAPSTHFTIRITKLHGMNFSKYAEWLRQRETTTLYGLYHSSIPPRRRFCSFETLNSSSKARVAIFFRGPYSGITKLFLETLELEKQRRRVRNGTLSERMFQFFPSCTLLWTLRARIMIYPMRAWMSYTRSTSAVLKCRRF